MSVLYLVVPLAIVVVLVALLGFVWAARHGQFDDLDTPAVRMLNDDRDGRGTNGEPAAPEAGARGRRER